MEACLFVIGPDCGEHLAGIQVKLKNRARMDVFILTVSFSLELAPDNTIKC